jgi:hypothetical protein
MKIQVAVGWSKAATTDSPSQLRNSSLGKRSASSWLTDALANATHDAL